MSKHIIGIEEEEAERKRKQQFAEEYSLSDLFDKIDACGDDLNRQEEKAEWVGRYLQHAKAYHEKHEHEKTFTQEHDTEGFHFTTHAPRYTLTRHIKEGEMRFDFSSTYPKLRLYVKVPRAGEKGEALVPPAYDLLRFRDGKLEAVTCMDKRGVSIVKAYVQEKLGNEISAKLGAGLGEGKSAEERKQAGEVIQQRYEKFCNARAEAALKREVAKAAKPLVADVEPVQPGAVERYASRPERSPKGMVLG